MQTVDEATQALWDYINSLEPEQRQKAIDFQRGLEAEAAKTEGGMMAVIPKRIAHLGALLVETLDELNETTSEVIMTSELDRIRRI